MSRTRALESEQSVLGSLMLWPELFDKVSDLITADDFTSEAYKAIYREVSGLILASKGVDVIAVYSQFQRREDTLVSLEMLNELANSVASPKAIKRHAENVRLASMERKLQQAADEASEVVEGEGDYADRLERVTALFNGLAAGTQKSAPRLVRDIAIQRIDYVNDLAMGNVEPGWLTGIGPFDRFTGGLRPGKVYVIAARPAVGKSSWALQAMIGCAKAGKTGLFLSQEMPVEEITDRGIVNMGRVNYTQMQTGKLDNDGWGRLTDGVEAIAGLPLYMDYQAGLTLADIRSKARSIKGLKILCIDYLQLCTATLSKGATRSQEVGSISRGAKILADELGCAVLLLSQLNRVVDGRANKQPTLSDLRDSGEIEQDADVIQFLYPVKQYSDEPGHWLIGSILAKQRNGAAGQATECGLDFLGANQLWRESSDSIHESAKAPAWTRGKRPDFTQDGDD